MPVPGRNGAMIHGCRLRVFDAIVLAWRVRISIGELLSRGRKQTLIRDVQTIMEIFDHAQAQ